MMKDKNDKYLDAVHEQVQQLGRLLCHREPGLSSWCQAYGNAMQALSDLWDKGVDGTEDKNKKKVPQYSLEVEVDPRKLKGVYEGRFGYVTQYNLNGEIAYRTEATQEEALAEIRHRQLLSAIYDLQNQMNGIRTGKQDAQVVPYEGGE